MLFEIVSLVVYVVLLSIGGMVLFVLYRRYCSESAHYSVVNSTKASRSPLYPNLEHIDSTAESVVPGAPVDLDEQDPADSKDRATGAADNSKISSHNVYVNQETFSTREAKAVENDYVVPSELKTVVAVH